MDKKKSVFVIVLVLLFGIVCFISFSNSIKIKNVDNDNFKINYDSTWKLSNTNDGVLLIHKKSKATLDIKCKILDDTFIDTNLDDLIDDIMYSVKEQNSDYHLISIEEDINDKYDSCSYLYEKDNEQVLVNVYKKDTKLVIAYYSCESDYFDIVLDSVDFGVRRIIKKVGEK